MRISEFGFESTQKGWKLLPIEFADLTLLVGVSGVGKTRILKSIASMVGVAQGKARSGSKWLIKFTDEDLRHCEWSGEFERIEDEEALPELFEFMEGDDDESQKKKAKIIEERLTVDGRIIIDRQHEKIELLGERAPKLSPHESAIHLFREEDELKPIAESFERIVFSDRTETDGFLRSFAAFNSERLVRRHTTIDSIKKSSHNALTKLFLAHGIQDRVFFDVKDRFIGVFPSVEDVTFSSYKDSGGPEFLANVAFVQIKERGVESYIPQRDISSGMIRTLSHLAELYLSPAGTVILIDEFENSLGVNCIDAVTEDLLDASSNIQFILTSHHPYIINNVSTDYWKVVYRDGASVSTANADDLGIGASSHDAFLQLINAGEFLEGIRRA